MKNQPSGEMNLMAQKLADEARQHVSRMMAARHGENGFASVILALTGISASMAEMREQSAVRERVVKGLQLALVRERGKARVGSRRYDFNRHVALHQALRTLGEIVNCRCPGPAGET
ncbi:MAG: hypothetical protein R3D32_11210 [Nitratireductor sp.]